MSTNANSPQALYARAFDLHRQGRREAARATLEQLLEGWPGHVDARNLAGVICLQRREFDAAVAHLRHAAAAGGGPGVLVNLGLALQGAGLREQAAQAYAHAVRKDPRLSLAWQKLGELHEATGRPAEALDAYRRALAIDPGDLKSLAQAVVLKQYLCDWHGDPTPEALVSAFATASRVDCPPWPLLALPAADGAMQKTAAARFAQSRWGAAMAQPPLVRTPEDASARRLRVGYLSADFRTHAVSFLALETIAAHDRAAVEVFVYAYGPDAASGDPWRSAAVAAADRFVELGALDDRQAAERIARDGIDVLVDLTGYTGQGRPGILAARPSAVIAAWIGYIGTMGAPRLADYVIGDRVATPLASASHFSESLAWLPVCFQPNAGLRPMPSPPMRQSEGLPPEGTVFCSFNQSYKLHPALWDDWCEILRNVPGSVLWLASPRHAGARDNLQAEASRRGVDPDRLVFADRRDRDAHLARIPLADLALDTWPYNSGTTASDALRMGVPLLAFPGDTFAGRMAASLLHALGLRDCIAANRDECVALAIAMGRDLAGRRALRERLRALLPGSAVYSPQAQAKALERLYRAMHETLLAGNARPVEVAPEP